MYLWVDRITFHTLDHVNDKTQFYTFFDVVWEKFCFHFFSLSPGPMEVAYFPSLHNTIGAAALLKQYIMFPRWRIPMAELHSTLNPANLTQPTCCTAECRASRSGCHEISGWTHLDNRTRSTGADNLSIAAGGTNIQPLGQQRWTVTGRPRGVSC